jgi:putative ABC transport system permease protein
VKPRGLRALVIGEAGFRLALALAAVAGLTAFVATAGPREVAASQANAATQALAGLPPAQNSIVVTADWFPQAGRPATMMTMPEQAGFGSAIALGFPAPINSPAAGTRAFIAGPLLQLPTAARSAIYGGPPEMQLNFDSRLPADARLVAGTWPGAGHLGLPGRTAADRDALVLQVAVTRSNAARFSLHPGSFQLYGVLHGRAVWLQVTGVVQPRPHALFWGSGEAQTDPTLSPPSSRQFWIGGVILGPAGLAAMQSAMVETDMHGQWYFPVSVAHITPAGLGALATAISGEIESNSGTTAARASGFKFPSPPVISSGLPGELTGIQAELIATGSIDSLIVAGLFAAGLLLMLLCAGLAAGRYEAELALIRARGASLLQVFARALARTVAAVGPGIAAGVLLAARAGIASTGSDAVILPGLTALLAIGSVPVLCTWRVRKSDSAQAGRRADLTTQRRSPRRLVAEAALLVVTAGAVVALRLRGIQSGTNQLGVISPVLVAIAASIGVGRLYPVPVRALLPLASGRRGPVGFLGLTRTGRSGLATMLPALALVLTMTLAAFGWMVTQSITAGQVASSWSRSGADAVVTATGNNIISTSVRREFAAVPGVRHTALVYTALGTTPYAPSLYSPAGHGVPLSLAVVSPGPYAALAQDTPWPVFPAAALAQRKGPVPILISAAAAGVPGVDATAGSHQLLELDGIRLPVVVAGSITDTPAFPAGGAYVVLPQWAAGSFPSIAGPSTLLVTGPAAAPARLAALAARDVPGGPLVIRADLVRAQQVSVAKYAVRLFVLGSWAAAGLSLVALLFGLAATAPGRRILRTRMSAMGMSSGQARALTLFDPAGLLAVAIAGMVVAGTALSLISRQVVNLAALTSSASPAPVTLDAAAILIPAAGVIAAALAAMAVEHVLASRAESATALRFEEAG